MPRVPTVGRPQRYPATRLALLKAVPRGAKDVGGPFASLTWPQQRAAEQWLWKFCLKWGNDLPPWRRGILIGVAKRLAVNPPVPRFGKRLHGCRGGRVRGRSILAGWKVPIRFRCR